MTKRSSTKYYKQFYPTTRRPHWSRSENQRAFLWTCSRCLQSRRRHICAWLICVGTAFLLSSLHTMNSLNVYIQAKLSHDDDVFSIPLHPKSPSHFTLIPLIWRLFLFDWFSRYSDLSSCWARSEFKVIPLFCNAQFYSASFFQDGGRRHRIDRGIELFSKFF